MTSDGALRVLDPDSGEPRSADRRSPWHSAGTPPIPAGGGYLTVTDQVRVLNRDGTVDWTQSLPGNAYAVSRARPATTGATVLVGTDDQQLVGIDAAAGTVERFGSATLDAAWWTLSDDGSLLVVGERTLETTVVDVRSGAVRWREFAGLTPFPTFATGSVVTGVSVEGDVEVRSYRARSGDLEWRTAVPGEGISYTAPLEDSVLAVSRTTDGATGTSWVTTLDAASGDVLAQSAVDTLLNRAGAVVENTGYLTGRNGAVYTVDAAGTLDTEARVDTSITSPPAVSADSVVFGDGDGSVRAVSRE